MAREMRTAVLVVHGIGSQRPLETVRGIVDAVWFDDTSESADCAKRIWTHPEPSGVDIDLTVMTTSSLTGEPGGRTADFHELYWAHLMSETRAVAVLLWLFELGRKGPRFTTAMNALWWCVAVFLCLLLLSASILILKAFVWFSGAALSPYKLAIAPYGMIAIGVAAGVLVAWWYSAQRMLGLLRTALFGLIALAVIAVGAAFTAWRWWGSDEFSIGAGLSAAWATNVLLPPAIALLSAYLLMGKWGLRAFGIAYALSLIFWTGFIALLGGWTWITNGSLGAAWAKTLEVIADARVPWSLQSQSSVICAGVIIGVYLVANATFLQSYLGDAARYFRNSPANIAVRREIRKQAVDTLDLLHRLRIYDRIIVVAHSLGSVVAYDMLRTYYSRVCDLIFCDPEKLQPEFDEINSGKLTADELRARSRIILRKMAGKIRTEDIDKLIPEGEPPITWLVTDFVTLGSPLTHARCLMCNGDTFAELNRDFDRRREEREFPTCPPSKHPADPDGWLVYTHPTTRKLKLHHGGLFALTRWTNLYFPMSQLLWGDPIGGPVGATSDGKRAHQLFGSHIADVKVGIRDVSHPDFFTHTAYWSLTRGDGYNAPHIKALREAINLEDKP